MREAITLQTVQHPMARARRSFIRFSPFPVLSGLHWCILCMVYMCTCMHGWCRVVMLAGWYMYWNGWSPYTSGSGSKYLVRYPSTDLCFVGGLVIGVTAMINMLPLLATAYILIKGWKLERFTQQVTSNMNTGDADHRHKWQRR